MRYPIILGLVIIPVMGVSAFGVEQNVVPGKAADEPLVDVAKVDPTIVIELRYATPRNVTGHAIYPQGTCCLVRSGVAERLKVAQQYLRARGFRLKIWDAYRPAYAQKILWDAVKNYEFTADPAKGRALHTWGVAVDVTLVNFKGKDVPMPTDFDDFTPAANDEYHGGDPVVARNFNLLKHAMHKAGFYGFHPEWWHYMAEDWKDYDVVVAGNLPPESHSFGLFEWIRQLF
ncbi:MAG: M15 family metallopeptidase [Chthoniobacteraceae bacterium]